MPSTYPVSYTTCSLMMTTLPEIGSVSTITSDHLVTFAGQAEAEINARLSKQYAIPFTFVVPVLQTLATDFAIYRLLTRRLYTAQRLKDSPWPDRYAECSSLLADIANGNISLLDSTGTIVGARTDVQQVYSTTKNNIPTFFEGHIGDCVQDPDKIDDEMDRRV